MLRLYGEKVTQFLSSNGYYTILDKDVTLNQEIARFADAVATTWDEDRVNDLMCWFQHHELFDGKPLEQLEDAVRNRFINPTDPLRNSQPLQTSIPITYVNKKQAKVKLSVDKSRKPIQIVDISSTCSENNEDAKESKQCLSEIEQLKQQLQISQKSIQEYESQKAEQQSEIQLLNAKLTENKIIMERQQTQIVNLQSTNIQLNSELDCMRNQISSTNTVPIVKQEPTQNEDQNNSNDELKQQVILQQQKIQSLTEQLTHNSISQKKFDAQNDYLHTIEEMNKLLLAQLKNQDGKQVRNSDQCTQKMKQLSIEAQKAKVDDEQRIQMLEAKITDSELKLQNQEKLLNDQKTEHQYSSNQFENHIAKLQQKVDDQQDEINSFEQKIGQQRADAEKRVRTLRNEHKLLEIEMENKILQQKSEIMQVKQEKQRICFMEEKKVLEELRQNQINAISEINKANQHINTLQQQLNSKEKEIKELKEETKLINGTKDNLIIEISKMRSQLVNLQTICSNQQNTEIQLQNQQNEVQQLKQVIQDYGSTIETARTIKQHYEELEHDIITKMKNNDAKLHSLESLNRRLLEQCITAKKTGEQ